jgi:hypothetical protein
MQNEETKLTNEEKRKRIKWKSNRRKRGEEYEDKARYWTLS